MNLADIRLDYINNIDSEYIEKMAKIREEFKALDHTLRSFGDLPNALNSGALRTLSLARTNLEIACQFAIKSLCLIGEDTEPTVIL